MRTQVLAISRRSPMRLPHLLKDNGHHWLQSHCFSTVPLRTRSNLHRPLPHSPNRAVSTVGPGSFEPRSNFGPFVPPDPKKLGKPRAANQYPRARKYGRRLFYFALVGGAFYLIDDQFNYSTITRSLRTFYTGLFLTIDYKLNFKAGHDVSALHERSANRVFDLLSANGGLYLKIGQAVAMQNAVLPPAWQQKFARLFDEAPQASWDQIEKLMKEEYGDKWRDIFIDGSFEQKAIGSASIAQVHKARLTTGELVAVKIQKPQIAKWVKWDLWAWGVLMYMQSKLFDVPFYFMVPFISERLMSEADFENEASNQLLMKSLVEADPSLRDRVYVPKVYTEFSTRRILVQEFIDNACKLWDKDLLEAPYKGDDMIGKEIGKSRAKPQKIIIRSDPHAPLDSDATALFDSPIHSIDGRRKGRIAGYGLSLKEVMSAMIDLYGSQMYLWGHVHADPHPANCLVRRQKNGKPQFVLIDHGLSVDMGDKLRREYSEFWMALLTFDNNTIARIANNWGFGAPDFLASAVLLKPYEGGDGSFSDAVVGEGNEKDTAFEMHSRLNAQIKEALKEIPKMPKELVFLGRAMRILQGCNQHLGSPVNRVKRMALYASKGYIREKNMSWRERMKSLWHYAVFRVMIMSLDVMFILSRVRQVVYGGGGFEDVLERQMQRVAKDSFGIELREGAFEG